MPLRKKQRHIAEVNMSSMTDIIFMLLIFFMLTSTLVKFLDFELPKSDSRTNTPVKTTINIRKNGKLAVNEKTVTYETMETTLRAVLGPNPDKTNSTIAIAAEKGVTSGEVTKAMMVANRLKVPVNIATEPKE
jgi:biopolymer transport protein ExbD